MEQQQFGPKIRISQEMHSTKYRAQFETFEDAMNRIAGALADDPVHYRQFRDILLDMRFLPAGRVQTAMGSARQTTPYNCFVSGVIDDSIESIMDRAKEAVLTMRVGGGIGYDFSRLRPKGELIKSLDSRASGPISFMSIFDACCKTISGAGHRRGAQMAVLRIDHPDIEYFINAKKDSTSLTAFNISVGVTYEFMQCVLENKPFDLKFGGKVYKTVDSMNLWNEIMRATWDWAEPGVLFLDRANQMNNLRYCETFETTNPCAEQWLPAYGACLLGSFNLTKYIKEDAGSFFFDMTQFIRDIPVVVRAMDNIVDKAIYPLTEQYNEAKAKRRMGLGVTGVANAIEALSHSYGSKGFLTVLDDILSVLTNECYRASAELAGEKGSFPLYDQEKYLSSEFIKVLNNDVREKIKTHGIRNSHLTSIAPTGTISLTADNVSSGIEPVFALEYDRTIQTFEGPVIEKVQDYGVRVFGVKGKTADECTVQEHLAVLLTAQRWIDSSISKTCNVGSTVTFDEFKDIYMDPWKGGAKGCTTFRSAGKRYGILNATPAAEDGPVACFIDPETGAKSCDY